MSNENELGALWAREDRNGGTYYSGVLTIGNTAYKIVVFPNNYKKEDNHPDFRILRSKPREESKAQAEEHNQEALNQGNYPQEDINPEDIPF